MATFAIDALAQQLRATGVVEPLPEWIEDRETGRRRPSDVQARDESGQFLWSVEAQYLASEWGRQKTEVVRVTVPAMSEPAVTPFELVPFTGLSVAVSPNKVGGLRQTWTAQGIGQTGRKGEAA